MARAIAVRVGAPAALAMKKNRVRRGKNSMKKPTFRAGVLFLVLSLLAVAALANTVTYVYDALGRLQEVRYPNGNVVNYALDPAGNRTEVASRAPPGVPASITVPSSNTSGSYNITWTAASGTLTKYELYESTNSGFSSQTLEYSGTALTKAMSGKASGTYYYRVRACNGAACGGYRTGANAVTVNLTPGVPASITVPASSSTGSYTVSWGTSTGTVTAYQLYEATNSSFTGQVQAYSGTGTSKAISGKANGSYYYRVRACNGSICSGYRTGANATTVTLVPPAAPASISGPLMNTTGNYSISWSSSTGASRYELWESVFGSSFSKVHDGPATSKSFSNQPNGEYEYKAKACNVAGCSGFSPTRFVQVCVGGCSFAPPSE
jgi:YD repeat-containing protein